MYLFRAKTETDKTTASREINPPVGLEIELKFILEEVSAVTW
jgi:hypothetical protein